MMNTNYTTKSKLIDSPILPLNSKEFFSGTAKSQFYKENREEIIHGSEILPKWGSAFEMKNFPSKASKGSNKN